MNAIPTTTGNKISTRAGGWILTFTGKQFWPADPRPEDVCIEDIAHSLSQICRFGGHTKSFYSVAQHSVLVSSILPPALKLYGLLHDATEAYVGDMVRPLKHQLPEYREMENKVWWSVARHFGLLPVHHELVKLADDILLVTERPDLLPESGFSWGSLDTIDAAPEKIIPLASADAERLFLQTFRDLTEFAS